MKETDLVELLKAGAPVAVWADERFAMRVLQLDTPCDTFMLLDRSRKVEKSIPVETVREVLVKERALEVCRSLGIKDAHLSERTSLVLVHGEPNSKSSVCAFLVDDVEKQTALQKCLEYVSSTAPKKGKDGKAEANGTNGLTPHKDSKSAMNGTDTRRPETEDEISPGAPRDLNLPKTTELQKKDDDKAWEVWDKKKAQEDSDEDDKKNESSCSDRMCENSCTIA